MTRQYKSKIHYIFTLVVIFILQSDFFIPKMFTILAQVGVDARDSGKKNHKESKKKRPKDSASTKKNAKSDQLKTHTEMGTLILKTDLACRVIIDGKDVGEILIEKALEHKLEVGSHYILAHYFNGLYTWTQQVQIEKSKRLEVNIQLKAKKTAAEIIR